MIEFTDFFGISGEEYFGCRYSFEYIRSRILRIFFLSRECLRERFFSKGVFTDHSWDESHDTIDPDEACELSTREYIVSYRDFSNIEKLEESFVDSLIVSTDDTILNFSNSTCLRSLLCVQFSARREIENLHGAILSLEFTKCKSERLYCEYCPRTSSIGSVIDSSSIAHCPISEIMNLITKEPLVVGSFHDATLEVWLHALWEERE